MSDPTDTETAAGERAPTGESLIAHFKVCDCHDSWDQCPCADGGHPKDGSCGCCRFGIGLCGPLPAPVREPDEAAVAELIHRSDCGCSDWRSDDQEDQTYREHARAILASDWLAEYAAKARAAELREAADGIESRLMGGPTAVRTLHERADRIDGGAR